MRSKSKLLSLLVLGSALPIHSVHALGSGRVQPADLPMGTVAANVRFLAPHGQESCLIPSLLQGPSALMEKDGRLIPDLRAAAKIADPAFSLRMAAVNYALGNPLMGRAFADLAVTGRASFSRFKGLHRQGALKAENLVANPGIPQAASRLKKAELVQGMEEALDRAFRVAHTLAAGPGAERDELGWITVSGEDDGAYRPVNVPATRETQHSLTVSVNGIPYTTRYIVAEGLAEAPVPPAFVPGQLPVIPEPTLSAGARVLLYMHGMDSRLEEAEDLIRALRVLSHKTGQNWTVISFDLPTSGYASQLDHSLISAISEIGHARNFPPGFDAGGRHRVPVLDFVEDAVVAFVDALDARIPVKDQLVAAIGGSLGGNLGFRLGRRAGLPWLKNIVTWSPAAIWDSLADGADIFKQLGVATAWKRAGGDTRNLMESEKRRHEFFTDAFGGAISIGSRKIIESQPDQWWSKRWPCYDPAHKLAYAERQEIYSRNFRLWHWRLGAEQLIFSQQTERDPYRPMLLMSGEDDDFNFTNIYSSTLKTARHMTRTPGRAVFFGKTGHSIHNERPEALAEQIVDFLNLQ